MKKQIVLVADDFGMNAKINEAILHAHVAGGLHAAALMMAQPGTEEAVAMARAHPRLQTGWHLHLNDSHPATLERWPWGSSPVRAGISIGLSRGSREIMRREVARQWELFRSTGLPCHFVNSHHHLHAHPAVYRALVEVLGPNFKGWIRLGRIPLFPARVPLFLQVLPGRYLSPATAKIVNLALNRYVMGVGSALCHEGPRSPRRHPGAAGRLSRIPLSSPNLVLPGYAMPARTHLASDRLNPFLLQALFRIHHTPKEPANRPFCHETDGFAFANETVWNYVEGEVRPQAEREPALARRYTRHCFVMVRAALQFWKFARFHSAGSPLPNDELVRRIHRVCARHVWLPPLPREQRIVFPGFGNLREISASAPGLFQDHIGAAWPVYIRVGNFPICLPVSGRAKTRLNGEILRDLEAGYPTLLWLYNFPSLNINHTVLVYKAMPEQNRVRYSVYDPNYAEAPKELQFEPATQTFTFEPTFYFKGGPVTPRAVYRGFFE